jgi:hypothetical protein
MRVFCFRATYLCKPLNLLIMLIIRMGEERKVYKVLVGKPEGRRPLGRPRRRWEDGVRMDLREIGLGGVDWIRLAEVRDRWGLL